MQKACATPDCGIHDFDKFYHDRTRPDRRARYCKKCSDAKRKQRSQGDRSEYRRIYYRKRKREAMDQYGGACQCCGEHRLEFLTLDHLQQDGAEQRRKMSQTGTATGYGFYIWLKKNGWPSGLQVLCANCNTARGAYGQCPHELERLTSPCSS